MEKVQRLSGGGLASAMLVGLRYSLALQRCSPRMKDLTSPEPWEPAASCCGWEQPSQMPRHLISDAHEWINEIPTRSTRLLAPKALDWLSLSSLGCISAGPDYILSRRASHSPAHHHLVVEPSPYARGALRSLAADCPIPSIFTIPEAINLATACISAAVW